MVRIASYGPQIDQSHGKNRISHLIKFVTANLFNCLFEQLNIHSSVDQFLAAGILGEKTWS